MLKAKIKPFISAFIAITIVALLSIVLFRPTSTLKLGVAEIDFSNSENSPAYLCNIYEGLVRIDPGKELRPALAESWGNIDEKTWEFKIRPSVFSDGSSLEASDILESVRSWLDQNSSSELAQNTASVELSTEHPSAIIFRTKNADPLLLHKISDIVVRKDNPGYLPYGTGPYQIESWPQEDQLVLVKNPHWRGPDPVWSKVLLEANADLSAIPENPMWIPDIKK